MSLLKYIYAVKKETENRSYFAGSLGSPVLDSWNLATVNFETREQAQEANDNTRVIYDDIVENQTWVGLQNQGKDIDATKVAFRHHMWIDENDEGFTLCISFDQNTQTRDFMSRTQTVLGEMEYSSFKILQNASDKINKYMTASRSVEVDLIGVASAKQFAQSFKEAADPTALGTNLIRKQDGFRVIAYFANDDSAQEFTQRIHGTNSKIRSLPAPKPEQPKRFQVA